MIAHLACLIQFIHDPMTSSHQVQGLTLQSASVDQLTAAYDGNEV